MRQRQLNTTVNRGFTLVELLVVISIIGILAALIVANFVGARSRASDATKKADLRSIKTALQLFHNDYNIFPEAANGLYIRGCGVDPLVSPSNCLPGEPFSAGAGSTVYMNSVPEIGFRYRSGTNDCEPTGQTFLLFVTLENASDEDIVKSQERCDPASRCYYNTTPSALDYFMCED